MVHLANYNNMSEILLRVSRPNQPPRFMPNNEQNLHSMQHSIRYGRESMRVELVEVINNDYNNTTVIRTLAESENMQIESEANSRLSAKDAKNAKLQQENEQLRKELEALKQAAIEPKKKATKTTTEIISEL